VGASVASAVGIDSDPGASHRVLHMGSSHGAQDGGYPLSFGLCQLQSIQKPSKALIPPFGRCMPLSKFFYRNACGQRSRRKDLDSIGKDRNPSRFENLIIAMGEGVDHCLMQCLRWVLDRAQPPTL
jgi:hypothetical protein